MVRTGCSSPVGSSCPERGHRKAPQCNAGQRTKRKNAQNGENRIYCTDVYGDLTSWMTMIQPPRFLVALSFYPINPCWRNVQIISPHLRLCRRLHFCISLFVFVFFNFCICLFPCLYMRFSMFLFVYFNTEQSLAVTKWGARGLPLVLHCLCWSFDVEVVDRLIIRKSPTDLLPLLLLPQRVKRPKIWTHEEEGKDRTSYWSTGVEFHNFVMLLCDMLKVLRI